MGKETVKDRLRSEKGCDALVEFTEKEDDGSSANDIWLRSSYWVELGGHSTLD